MNIYLHLYIKNDAAFQIDPYEIEQKILNLRNKKCHDYNLVYFKESLEEYKDQKISYTYLI